MKLSFKYVVKKISKEQEEIVKDLEWYTKKVMNMLLYDIKEKKEIIDERKSINIIATPIYRRYREENWHSKYLHSHMLLEAIMSVIGSYKSYITLKKKYEENKKLLKGEPKYPRYKNEKQEQEIVFTKYAVRIEGNIIKLSISKEMQEKNKVKSLNFLIPRKLRKRIINFRIKMIKIIKISEKYTSGVSAIDNEEVKKENYNKKRRKYRGLFITENGKKINADINGSLNILRKYIKNYIPNQEIAMDNGREQRPIKKRVA